MIFMILALRYKVHECWLAASIPMKKICFSKQEVECICNWALTSSPWLLSSLQDFHLRWHGTYCLPTPNQVLEACRLKPGIPKHTTLLSRAPFQTWGLRSQHLPFYKLYEVSVYTFLHSSTSKTSISEMFLSDLNSLSYLFNSSL